MACTSNETFVDCGNGWDVGCPDAGVTASLPECPGPCVPAPPVDWSEPLLLWIGIPGEAPACPEGAPVTGYHGRAELAEPPDRPCPTCSCEAPSITCEPPHRWTTNGWTVCPGDGLETPHLIFDAPDGWDGSCTTENAISAGVVCDGDKCVKALSVEPPVAKSGACNPKAEEPSGLQDVMWSWQLEAKACKGENYPECTGSEDQCAPPLTEGFFTCVYRVGENECSPAWPAKHVFYEGVDDTRSCTECACGDVEGASCTVLASAYSDAACTQIVISATMSSEAEGGLCAVLAMPGPALGSKSASVTSLVPGSCTPSGGLLTGTAEPSKPSTFCCRY